MGGMRAAFLIAFCLFGMSVVAQQAAPPTLPPSEALKAATAPYNAARAQPNDLTDADMLALGVGVERASHDCGALQASLDALTKQPDELIALARLCIFGQQFEPARAVAVRYLTLPSMPQREMALLLLVQAFLGLKNPTNAAEQVFTLERDFAYDTQIYFAADQVILAAGLMGDQQNAQVLQLCGDQLKVSLPLLESGKGFAGKEGNASPSTLFADAVRCVDLERDLHDLSGTVALTALEKIVQLPAWQATAELAPMQAALARTLMVGKPAPVAVLDGRVVRAAGPLLARRVALTRGTTLLVPFTMWAPSTQSMIRDFPATAPQQELYLVTSWAANTGDEDAESPELLASLRSFAQSLPAHVTLLVTPESFLQAFHADAYPGVIVVRDGTVQANTPLVGEAAKRMAVLALGLVSKTPATRRGVRQ